MTALSTRVARLLAVAVFVALAVVVTLAQAPASRWGLTILVVAGEDSVNVIQQRTAVAPIVEVRDRNNQPVAGALVMFTIGDRSKLAGGQKTITVTSDAGGRATAGEIVPVQSGRANINVRASYQGQTATASIRQVNVLTPAQAATVVASGGAAAAGGGGLSPVAIGVIAGGGGAAALLAIAATSGDDDVLTPSNQFTVPQTLTAPFSTTETFVVTPPGCTVSVTNSGTISVTIQTRTASLASGVGSFVRTLSNPSPPSCGGFAPTTGSAAQNTLGSFSGAPDTIQMSITSGGNNGVSIGSNTYTFSGRLTGSEITGTLTTASTTTILSNGLLIAGSASVTVTLR